MHHSRFCGFIIDSRTDDLESAAEFWSGVLGRPIRQDGQIEKGKYAALDTDPVEPVIEVQKVSHESRIHLDIETDDIEAEAARLERLGARRIKFVRKHWVMEAPTGHRFCVLPAESRDFPENANRWE